MIGPMIELAAKAFPKQGNEFAFVISKNARLQPWLSNQDGDVRPDVDAIRRMGRVYRRTNRRGVTERLRELIAGR